MSVSKTAVTISSLALAMMFGGGVYLMMNFGTLAQQMAERIASKTLGVSVSIGSVDIDFQDKAVTVSKVKVGNPAGYSGSHAATIEKIYMKADKLSQVLLRFNDVAVSGSEVYLEVKENGTNLTDIKKTVDSKAAKGDQAAKQIKVIIEKMRIEKMRVIPSVLLAAGLEIEPIVVPDIILTGIGVKENGVLASEAIGQIWADIVSRVNRSASQAGYYEGLSPEALEDMGATQLQQIKGQISEEVDKIGEGIKGLFGNE